MNISKINEEDIEKHLFENIGKLDSNLKPIKRQFKINVGVIDILAKDTKMDGVYAVIEIKKGSITCEAVVQVLRYTIYLNDKFSKYNTRKFIPIVIGSSLEQSIHLKKLLRYFEGLPDVERDNFVYYRLCGVDLDGCSFDWHDIKNLDYTKEYDEEV